VRLLATPGADAGISSVRMAYRQVNQKKLAPPALPFCSLTSPHEKALKYEFGILNHVWNEGRRDKKGKSLDLGGTGND
jgi:hypothetical protein